jgi:peptide/nickel transport system permease protein
MMGDAATTGALADCQKSLGMHRPLAVQYADYIWKSVQFDFGKSLRQGYPVSEYIARMLPHTFILVVAAAVVAAAFIALAAQRAASAGADRAASPTSIGNGWIDGRVHIPQG